MRNLLSIGKLHFCEINFRGILDEVKRSRRGSYAMRIIKLNLGAHIKKRGITQKQYAELTGLREATISHLVNNKMDRVQLSHLLTVMDEMKTADFNDILTIEEID